MSFNLVVWKWSPDYETSAKRRKLGVKYGDVVAAFAEHEAHPAMAQHGFEDFERAVVEAVGPEVVDGPYIMERHACARVVNLPVSQVPALVTKLGKIAQKCGLTSAEL